MHLMPTSDHSACLAQQFARVGRCAALRLAPHSLAVGPLLAARNDRTTMRVHYLNLLCVLLSACQGSAASASFYIQHPDDPSKQIEFFLEHPASLPPWPTVVLLHGHQPWIKPGGKVYVNWGVLKQLADRGYLAVSISQPGYGKSNGPADYCGAFTQHAVMGVIAKLRADGFASQKKLLIEGVSRGALTAGLVAAQDPSVSALVLISGVYDLPAYVDDSNPGMIKKNIIAAMVAETGGTKDALEARSILLQAQNIKASVLILNGALDDRTDPMQANALAEKIMRGGGDARAIIYPKYGHKIPVDVRGKDIDHFIEEVFGESDGGEG